MIILHETCIFPSGPDGSTISPPSGPTPQLVFTPTPAPPGSFTGTGTIGNGPSGRNGESRLVLKHSHTRTNTLCMINDY